MSKKPFDVGTSLSWLGELLRYMNENGIWNIIKACLLMGLVVFVLRVCNDPEYFFEKYKNYADSKHLEQQRIRLKNDDSINHMLPSLLIETNGSRVWIIQYHNGISDWTYGSMRFEYCANKAVSIQKMYDNFHLSWLRLPTYLRYHSYFCGNTTALREIDPVLYDMFTMNEINYCACILVEKDNIEEGVLGITWNEAPKLTEQELILLLSKYAGKLEDLLTPQMKI